MAMDKIIKPEENEFISPLVNFDTFGQVFVDFLYKYQLNSFFV